MLIGHGLLVWAALAAAYVLLAGQISVDEALAGLVMTLLAAGYGVVLRLLCRRRMSLRAPWGRIAAGLLKAMVVETALLVRAILRGERGCVDHQPFVKGDKRDGGRRGLVTLATSLTPNGIVLRIEGQAIAVHRMVRTAPKPDRTWPL